MEPSDDNPSQTTNDNNNNNNNNDNRESSNNNHSNNNNNNNPTTETLSTTQTATSIPTPSLHSLSQELYTLHKNLKQQLKYQDKDKEKENESENELLKSLLRANCVRCEEVLSTLSTINNNNNSNSNSNSNNNNNNARNVGVFPLYTSQSLPFTPSTTPHSLTRSLTDTPSSPKSFSYFQLFVQTFSPTPLTPPPTQQAPQSPNPRPRSSTLNLSNSKIIQTQYLFTKSSTPPTIPDISSLSLHSRLVIGWLMLFGDSLFYLHKRFQESTINLTIQKYSQTTSYLTTPTTKSDDDKDKDNKDKKDSNDTTTDPTNTSPTQTCSDSNSNSNSNQNQTETSSSPPLELKYHRLLRNWAVAIIFQCVSTIPKTPYEEEVRSLKLQNANELITQSLSMTPSTKQAKPRSRTLYHWGNALRRLSIALDKEGNLCESFRVLKKASAFFRQAIELGGHTYVAPLLKWGHLLDDMVHVSLKIKPGSDISPSEMNIKEDLDIFLIFFSNRAMRDRGLSLKPLIALCLSPQKMVQSESLNLMRHLCTFAGDLEKEQTEWERERVREAIGTYGFEVMSEAQRTLVWIEQIVSTNNNLTTAVKIQALRNLNEHERYFWKVSNITYAQALDHFEVFMNCLSFHTRKPVSNLQQRFFSAPLREIESLSNLNANDNNNNSNNNNPLAVSTIEGKNPAQRQRGATASSGVSQEKDKDHQVNGARKRSETGKSKKIYKFQYQELFSIDDPHEHYKDFEKIGKGGFSEVFIARRKKNAERVAIKVLHRSVTLDSNLQQILKEIVFIKTSLHPNIVNYIESFHWDNKIWIVMEFCDAGNLKAFYSKVDLQESHISIIANEILEALKYLHSQHRIHRDLKCENVLMNLNGAVKLADMGIAAELNDEENAEDGEDHVIGLCGSKFWMAPEVISYQPYSYKADIWSFGCLLYEIIEKNHPYAGYHSLAAMFHTATRGGDRLKHPDLWSLELREFLDLIFQMDPENRPTAEELLNHRFLRKIRDNPEEKAKTFATLKQALEHAFIAQQFENLGMW